MFVFNRSDSKFENATLNETQREYKSVRTEALPEELGISAKTRRSTKEPYFV